MLANNRLKILQHVIKDPASSEVERAEATRQLNATGQSKSPRSVGSPAFLGANMVALFQAIQ
jgi:hypothetical protein